MRLKKQLFRSLAFVTLLVAAGLDASRFAGAVSEDAAGCVAVARIFEYLICRSDVAVEEDRLDAIRNQFESEKIDSADAIQARSLDRLREILWNHALSRRFDEKTLAPTEAEIRDYGTVFHESLGRNYEKNKITGARVNTLLAGDSLSADQRARLEALQSTLETSIAFYEQRESIRKDRPPAFHDMVAQIEHDMAAVMIREWKADKALYEAYGGRVVFHRGRPRPIGAYLAFLGYINKTGKLEIYDPAFRPVFDSIIVPSESDTPASGDSGTNYFAAPYWAQSSKERASKAER